MRKRARLMCVCGSREFRTTITLEVHDVPVWFDRGKALAYDDTKGRSAGWDVAAQPEVNCARCGHTWVLERQAGKVDAKGRPVYRLRDREGGHAR
jgi:hypothetical protein